MTRSRGRAILEIINSDSEPRNFATSPDRSSRATTLAKQLHQASEALITLVERIEPAQWLKVPKPGVWSSSKDAEHVADGAACHQWTVRLSLGQKVPRRPHIERAQLTAQRSQHEVVDLIRQRTKDGVALIDGLSDEQLDLTVQPPRARSPKLAQMIEDVLIGHYHRHRTEIEAKLRGPSDKSHTTARSR
jgi:hypothetical protein